MDQGNHQAFQQRPRLLERDAAGEVGARLLEKLHHPGQSFRREAYVGVQKEQQVIRCVVGEHPAGVLFATPAVWHLRTFQQPYSWVALGELRTMTAVASADWSSSTSTSRSTPELSRAASTAT